MTRGPDLHVCSRRFTVWSHQRQGGSAFVISLVGAAPVQLLEQGLTTLGRCGSVRVIRRLSNHTSACIPKWQEASAFSAAPSPRVPAMDREASHCSIPIVWECRVESWSGSLSLWASGLRVSRQSSIGLSACNDTALGRTPWIGPLRSAVVPCPHNRGTRHHGADFG
jgi:hypothetical protein